MKNKEYRTATIQSDDNLIVAGVPIVFDSPTVINSNLGSYIEVIKRSALDDADLSDIKLLYNHDLNRVPLARSPKTLNFDVDDKGLNIRAELPNTEEGKSVHTAIQRGDLTGMSFGFSVAEGGDTFDAKTNTRTINKIDKVFEISVVPFPAYTDTTLEARNRLLQAKNNVLESELEELKIKLNKILFRGAI